MSILKIFTISFLALLPLEVSAQWRIGLTGGVSIDRYSIDRRFLNTSQRSKTGINFGVIGQYNFSKVISARAELEYIQRKRYYYLSIEDNDDIEASSNYKIFKDYIQLPVSIVVMPPLNISPFNLWINAGIYGSYCFSQRMKGYEVMEHYDNIITDYNRKWGFGALAGIGLDYNINKHLVASLEIRYYIGITSSKKTYNGISNSEHDYTLLIRPSISYIF